MKITARAAFGWGPSGAREASPTKGLVVHYDGADQGLAGRDHVMCLAYWRRTRAFHMGPARGWADIGYSYGCCPHGAVFEGRGLGREQAAQPGGNTTYYSVTLMSGPTERPTPVQIDAVRQLRAWLMSKGVGGAVRGHRDFIETSCPGDIAYAMVRDGTFTRAASSEEDDVSAKDVWTQELKVPFGTAENPEWQAGNLLVNVAKWSLEQRTTLATLGAKLDAQNATIKALADALAAHHAEVDADALIARIEAAIEGITVRLDVPDAPAST
jgi:hypothetical protein